MAEQPSPAVTEAPKPALQRFFEAIAAIMELHRGRRCLELAFEDGRLVDWRAADKRWVPPRELAGFDPEAEWLVVKTRSL